MTGLSKSNTDANAGARQRMRLEQLLTVSRRLIDAVAADIAALEAGAFGDLKTADPEIERLCAFYGREVRALKNEGGLRQVSAPLLDALKESGVALDGLLKRHERLVAAMREASEGLVKAVAEGVEDIRSGAAPYKPVPQAKRATSGAIVYNNVI